MINLLKKLTVSLCVLATMSGCASMQYGGTGTGAHLEEETRANSRTRNVILTIGGILLVGAILANEAGDNVKDAVRDAARP